MSHMARALSYDPSYLSKICSGQRFPSSPSVFIEKLCCFVSEHYTTEASRLQLSRILNLKYPKETDSFKEALILWFHETQ